MDRIRCARCEKFWCDFVACTYALIAPVQPVLHRVSCSNEMVPNAPNLYETQQNMRLGSNGVHLVRLLQKFQCNFVARTFALIVPVRPVLPRVSCIKKNDSKCTQTLWNAPKHEFRIQCSRSVHLLRIILIWLQGIKFCINCTSSYCFVPSLLP